MYFLIETCKLSTSYVVSWNQEKPNEKVSFNKHQKFLKNIAESKYDAATKPSILFKLFKLANKKVTY